MKIRAESKFEINQEVYHKLKQGQESKGIVLYMRVNVDNYSREIECQDVEYYICFEDHASWYNEKILQEEPKY